MKTFKEFVNEDGAAPAMSMGAGIQGLSSAQGSPIAGYDKPMMGLRRKPQMTGLKSKKK